MKYAAILALAALATAQTCVTTADCADATLCCAQNLETSEYSCQVSDSLDTAVYGACLVDAVAEESDDDEDGEGDDDDMDNSNVLKLGATLVTALAVSF